MQPYFHRFPARAGGNPAPRSLLIWLPQLRGGEGRRALESPGAESRGSHRSPRVPGAIRALV